jgi:hypothetical protein
MSSAEKQSHIVTPMGMRVFTPDDWIVTVVAKDGRRFKKGVQPDVPEERAISAVLNMCNVQAVEVDQITIRRRRDKS